MSDDFAWKDVAEDTIVQSTGAIAVYLNPHNDIVIRQRSTDPYRDEDYWITVPPAIIPKLIKRLQLVLDERDPDADD